MSFNEMTPADIRACTSNNDGDGMFGGNGAWWIIILLLFGWGRNGFGGWGGNGNGCGAPCATQADVRAAVDQQTLISKLDQQTYGLADSTYALNNAITNGFHGAERSAWDISRQISDCCCDTKAAIGDVNVGIERAGWNLSKQISDCCCDVEKMNLQNRFDAQAYNCNTLQAIDKLGDRLVDHLNAIEDRKLRDELATLRLSVSQSAQNAALMAAMDANTATILRRTGSEYPSAAYLVQPPTPVNFPVNGCGQVQFGGCGCGAY